MKFEQQRVDPGIGVAAQDVGGATGVRWGSPRPPPGNLILFQGRHDLVGDLLTEFRLARHLAPIVFCNTYWAGRRSIRSELFALLHEVRP